jgi:hypothetical protein
MKVVVGVEMMMVDILVGVRLEVLSVMIVTTGFSILFIIVVLMVVVRALM